MYDIIMYDRSITIYRYHLDTKEGMLFALLDTVRGQDEIEVMREDIDRLC